MTTSTAPVDRFVNRDGSSFIPTPLSSLVVAAVAESATANPQDPASTMADIVLWINIHFGRPTKSGAVITMVHHLSAIGVIGKMHTADHQVVYYPMPKA